MSQIYQHASNRASFQSGVMLHFAIVIAFLITLSSVVDAQEHIDLPYQIDMTKHLDYNATIDDALALCEHWNGSYELEHDVCHVAVIPSK